MQEPCANEMAGYHRMMPAQEPPPTVRFAQQLVAGYHRLPETQEQCANELADYQMAQAPEQCDDEEEMSEEEMSRPDMDQIPHQATKDHQDEVPSLIPYEPFIPMDPLNAQDLRATKSSITKQLSALQHESVSNLCQDIRSRVTPYQDIFEERRNISPLFYGSWVIQNPETRDVFICKPCNKEGL